MGNSRFIISVALAIFASLSQATSARCWEAGAAHSSASVDGKKALIWQVAEQDLPMEALYDRRLANEFGGMGIADDTYLGLQRFWDSEIVGNLFPNVGQLLGKWLTEWLDGWAADTVGLLSAMLRTFFLNPNIAAHAQDSATISQDYDDISLMIRQAATVMYAIALDLLLFLFILAIWRYWTEAAWRGGLSVTGAVARLIFTSGILLAWPTICGLEIEISNEMIKAIFLGVTDQVQMLDVTLASTVRAGLVATAYLVAKSFLPTLGAWSTSIIGSTIGGAISTVALMIFLILTAVLIVQLVIILVMKAVQTVLLAAQYMFAPVFLIFFATPDTESIASSFIKSCVEVSLWTFAWVGLLKIMVILLFSAVSPWGKILMAIAILQIMIQVPSFLARASISPISPFAASGLISTGLKAGAIKLGTTLFEQSLSLVSAVTSNQNGRSVDRLVAGRGDGPRILAESEPPRFNNSLNEAGLRSDPACAIKTGSISNRQETQQAVGALSLFMPKGKLPPAAIRLASTQEPRPTGRLEQQNRDEIRQNKKFTSSQSIRASIPLEGGQLDRLAMPYNTDRFDVPGQVASNHSLIVARLADSARPDLAAIERSRRPIGINQTGSAETINTGAKSYFGRSEQILESSNLLESKNSHDSRHLQWKASPRSEATDLRHSPTDATDTTGAINRQSALTSKSELGSLTDQTADINEDCQSKDHWWDRSYIGPDQHTSIDRAIARVGQYEKEAERSRRDPVSRYWTASIPDANPHCGTAPLKQPDSLAKPVADYLFDLRREADRSKGAGQQGQLRGFPSPPAKLANEKSSSHKVIDRTASHDRTKDKHFCSSPACRRCTNQANLPPVLRPKEGDQSKQSEPFAQVFIGYGWPEKPCN